MKHKGKKFDRSKTHANVGSIGHVLHGQTTLKSAIQKVLSQQRPSKDDLNFISFSSKLNEMSKHNVLVRQAVLLHDSGQISYETMLEELVLSLVEANEKLTSDLINHQNTKPFNYKALYQMHKESNSDKENQ